MHMSAPSSIPFVSQANRNFFKNPMTKIWPNVLNFRGSIYAITHFAVLATYLETERSYFIDMSVKLYVCYPTVFLKLWFYG